MQPNDVLSKPLRINGGNPLFGSVKVQGAKNAALPIIIGSLLTDQEVRLNNVPRVRDVYTILEILKELGTKIDWVGKNSIVLKTEKLLTVEPSAKYVIRMRASFELLGALIGRAKEGMISSPGGCKLGPRPVDQHIKAFRALGVNISESDGKFYGVRRNDLSGTFTYDLKTVGGTRNLILASVVGSSTVTLKNASLEPEVTDLINFLNTIGGRIKIDDSNSITILGVPRLYGGEYTVIPDRMEAGTFLCAAAATGGCITLENINPAHLKSVVSSIQKIGVYTSFISDSTLLIDAKKNHLRPINIIATEYPGFPTDLHPQFASLLATIPGKSSITDTVFNKHRFTYIEAFKSLGINVSLSGSRGEIEGACFQGGTAKATDLRVGGALIIAALSTKKETIIFDTQHISRGYENIVDRLSELGANISHMMDNQSFYRSAV